MPANVGKMFYYGGIPWHKEGTPLVRPATAEEAIKAGGLDWVVRLVPIQTRESPPRSITKRMAVVRDDLKSGDPNAVLGVVHPGFLPLQNRDAVGVFDALLGRGKRVYHTGGYLGNGEVIWLLAKLPENITVAGNDIVEPYMLLANSHDGTIAIDFRLTTVRVVCQNTLALAMRKDRSSHIFKRAHQISPATLAAEGEIFFQFCTKAAVDLGETFQKMHLAPFGKDEFANLVARLLPLPTPPVRFSQDTSLRRQHETRVHNIIEHRKAIARVFEEGCSNGVKIPPAEQTLWGAMNAVTAFVDHKQKINGDRYAQILFGSGATLKQKAFDLAFAQLTSAF
jgi:phage/plasmid-like protein (TIGR03299 family)